MTIENDFLPFAVGGSANVLPQATYAADTTLLQSGFTAGIAKSMETNKVWRQSSIMAAVMASFIVAQTGQPAIDDGTTATLLANFTAGVVAASKQRVILTDTGSANAYAAANAVPLTVLPTVSGVVQTVQIAHTNTAASTYAPDGLAAKPIFGLGAAALQGGEVVTNGIATLVSYVGPLLNSGALCWVLYECIGGAQQVTPATQSGHAVQLGQLVGLPGTAINLKADLAAAGTSVTFTADGIITAPVLGGVPTMVSNINQTLNVANVGVINGLDATAALTGGWLAVYEVNNPLTGAAGLLGQAAASSSTVVPTEYAGGHPIAGYTNSALIAVVPVASGVISPFSLRGKTHQVTSRPALGTTTVTGTPTLSTSNNIPANATHIRGNMSAQATTAGAVVNMNIYPASNQAGGRSFVSTVVGASNTNTVPFDISVLTPGSLWYTLAVSAGSVNVAVAMSGYDIN